MEAPYLSGHSLSFGFPAIVGLGGITATNYTSGGTGTSNNLSTLVSVGCGVDLNGGVCNEYGSTKLDNIGYYIGMGLGFSTSADRSSYIESYDGGIPSGSRSYEYDYNEGLDTDSYERSSSFGPYIHAGFMFRPPGFLKYIGIGSGSFLGVRFSTQAGIGTKALNYNSISITWRSAD